jgi:peptidylprolyl isomerase
MRQETKMAVVKSGDKVKVHYTGTLADGSQFDSSRERAPLEVSVGSGDTIPGFESALVGMEPGDTRTVTVPAAEAYGDRDEERIIDVRRAALPDDIELQVGQMLDMMTGEGGRVLVTVAAFDEETVSLDANHPLAGHDLTFELELVEVL